MCIRDRVEDVPTYQTLYEKSQLIDEKKEFETGQIDVYKRQVLYHKRDSHWNNKGAAVAAETLLSSLKKEHVSYKKEPYTIKTDFTGDLDEMLYPLATTPEEEVYYDRQTTFAYVGEVGSNFDPKKMCIRDRTKAARARGLYNADNTMIIKKSDENPLVLELYEGLLKGKEHHLLHNEFYIKD